MRHRISKIGSSSSLTCVVVIGVAMVGSTASFAYRPFDGTWALCQQQHTKKGTYMKMMTSIIVTSQAFVAPALIGAS